MSNRSEHLSLLGLVLPVITLVAVVTALVTGDHLLLTLALALACVAVLSAVQGAVPVTARVVSVRHRSEVCRATGVRACDPDRPGRVRPRAPGLG